MGFGLLRQVDESFVKELENAWICSRSGSTSRECTVLTFVKPGGVYEAKLQKFTNEWKQSTFQWNPAAVAIIHTHPNSTNAPPSIEDQAVARKYGVPMFTITNRGMYCFDPFTNRTVKIFSGLDWLDKSRWTREVFDRSLIALLNGFKEPARKSDSTSTGIM